MSRASSGLPEAIRAIPNARLSTWAKNRFSAALWSRLFSPRPLGDRQPLGSIHLFKRTGYCLVDTNTSHSQDLGATDLSFLQIDEGAVRLGKRVFLHLRQQGDRGGNLQE